MKIRDIMTKEVTSISPDTSAKEAMELLHKLQISGLPVIDAGGKLVGVFTEKEILSYILPSYIAKVGRFIYEENPKSTRKKLHDLDQVKVSQLMRHDVVTTTEDTTLCELARVMLTQKARRIPVVDKAGKVIGIVARGDVLSAFIREGKSEEQ